MNYRDAIRRPVSDLPLSLKCRHCGEEHYGYDFCRKCGKPTHWKRKPTEDYEGDAVYHFQRPFGARLAELLDSEAPLGLRGSDPKGDRRKDIVEAAFSVDEPQP